MSDEQPSGQRPVEQPAPESSPAPAKSSAPPVPAQPAAAQPSPEEIAAMRERAAQEQLAVLAKQLNAMDTFRLFSEEEIRKKYVDQVPMRRPCTYRDVTSVVVFLASSDSGYMTGQAINVTGGQEMR